MFSSDVLPAGENNSDYYGIKDMDSKLVAEQTNESHNSGVTVLTMHNMKTEAVNSSWPRLCVDLGEGALQQQRGLSLRPGGRGRKDTDPPAVRTDYKDWKYICSQSSTLVQLDLYLNYPISDPGLFI